MQHTAVVGTQWGDEGKGKIVDWLARKGSVRVVVRYQGGNNAGHTVVHKGVKHAFHLLPSGMLYPKLTCVIGNGVIVNPIVLVEELATLEKQQPQHGKLLISEKAHLIMPWHKMRDGIAGGKIGTTGQGIGPTYTDYVNRVGIRMLDTDNKQWFKKRVEQEVAWNKQLITLMLKVQGGDTRKDQAVQLDVDEIVQEYWQALTTLKNNPLVEIGDVSAYLDMVQNQGGQIVFEGAQAILLDIAHGTYPYVTSSHPTVGGLYVGTGFRPRKLKVIGVAKAYTTRVGEGPFPTELTNQLGEQIRQTGQEFGTTTGRARRCGWLDMMILRYAKLVNGLDQLVMTKLDVLTGIDPVRLAIGYEVAGKPLTGFPADSRILAKVKVIYEDMPGWREPLTGMREFKQLPKAARNYITRVEKLLELPVTLIGVGPSREAIIRH